MNETCVVKARHGFFEKSVNYSLSVFGTAFFEKAVNYSLSVFGTAFFEKAVKKP
jgi:hypothetical protein